MMNKEKYDPAIIIDGKSPERVHRAYTKHSEDWKAEYNMLLMDGDCCGDCVHSKRCRLLFGGDDENTSCQFYPNKFYARSERNKESE